MISFLNDYSEGCHPKILSRLAAMNEAQNPGYGTDGICAQAAERIRRLCENDGLSVHFLVGGTQTNATVIAASLRPHQAVISAESGHIHVHETGAVEATGHKILAVPSQDGKLTPAQVERVMASHTDEHAVQPKMVYISNPTELGTMYSRRELEALHGVCRKWGLYLFLDGARLGYGLAARENDLTFPDLGRLTDVFYIGGTKVGALFGEAVVIAAPELARDFRYAIKQHGGMLAKGWLLGAQFDTLLTDGEYVRLAAHANALADEIRETLAQCGYPLLLPGCTNQIFPIFPDTVLEELEKEFQFTPQQRIDEGHQAVRICTSWATKPEAVAALCRRLREIRAKSAGAAGALTSAG